jgi:hypothetical protein
MNSPLAQLILADAHTHIYDCFDLTRFLDSALFNFRTIANQKKYNAPYVGVLFLTETSNDYYFQHFSTGKSVINGGSRGEASVPVINAPSHFFKKIQDNYHRNSQIISNWSFQNTSEESSLYAVNAEQQGLFLIAGRQIVTSENLEVLALAINDDFKDGQPLERIIPEVIERGGIPVIPWGFGKWIGARGQILTTLLKRQTFPTLFLGDNGGRPTFWGTVPHFKQAAQLGLKILPGSDPLPFASEDWRPGSFGFSLWGHLDPKEPSKSMKQLLLDPNAHLQAYGSLEHPFRFLRNQIAMQLRKRQRSNI